MSMTKSLSRKLYELLKSEFPNSSQNLAKFAKRRDYKKLNNRIIRSDNGDLYIGLIDGRLLIGSSLNRVVCGDFKVWAFSDIDGYKCKDVTEWFMEEYAKKGMCAYTDMRHAWNQDDHEEKLDDGSIRTCQHCGKVETLHSKMVRKTWWR